MTAASQDAVVACPRWPWLAPLASSISALGVAVLVVPVIAPLWQPAMVAAALGLSMTTALSVAARLGWGSRPRSGWALLGTALAVFTTCEWAIPLKTALAGRQAAAFAAHLLAVTPPPGFCSADPAYIDPFATLMDATSICVHELPNSHVVLVSGSPITSTEDRDALAMQGLIYAPRGAGPGETDGVCVRHIYGPWWRYQQLLLTCPSGMRPVGSG